MKRTKKQNLARKYMRRACIVALAISFSAMVVVATFVVHDTFVAKPLGWAISK